MFSQAWTLFISFYSHLCYAYSPANVNMVEKAEIPIDQISDFKFYLSVIGLIWWLVIISFTLYGFTEILFKFNQPKIVPSQVQLNTQKEEHVVDSNALEGVTILRPIKGIDPELELCLESCFLQEYPHSKLQILFCVESDKDPAIPIIERLIAQHPKIDAELLIDDNYESNHFGPNPKINNLAKGYKRAKFDILWVLDSNVWVNQGTLLRSTIALNNSLDNGRKTSRPIEIVHHVPLAISIDNSNRSTNLGARLDEMFLLTSHAKFYVFFNKASIAPCVNGKSNLYRRSELDDSVNQISKGLLWNKSSSNAEGASVFTKPGEGLRFFSRYIGEDNMIGIALWEKQNGGRTGMTGDIAIQPIGGISSSSNSIRDYVNRRVRWLRVRRYMVLFATLMEPTTESLVIGLFGSFGISNLLFNGNYMLRLLFINEILWSFIDYVQYSILLKYSNKDLINLNNNNLPYFMNSNNLDEKLNLIKWIPIWILREVLALPIWIIAMCGTEIDWRNRPFKIRSDLTAEEL